MVAAKTVAKPTQDTAVELELETTDRVLGLITTIDGTIKPLLDNRPAPPWLVNWIKENQPQFYDSPKDLKWELLPPKEQKALIAQASKGQDFFEDNQVHGLRVKPKVRVHFLHPTELFGRKYKKGWTTLSTKGFLLPKVEFSQPEYIQNSGGIEIHVRSGGNSGDVQNHSWRLLDGLRIPRNHQHVHIVSKLPVKRLKSNPKFESFRSADFVRRTNLLAEVHSIMEGAIIQDSSTKNTNNFKSYSTRDMATIERFFLDVAKGDTPELYDSLKLAWVGVRAGEVYKNPKLWGLEFRSISHNTHSKLLREVLNALQYAMEKDNLGISTKKMSEWKRKYPQIPLSKLWHHKPKRNSDAKVLELARKNKGFYLLLHDWSVDPMFHEKPNLLEQVQLAQANAIEKIHKKPREADQTLRNFVIESGLFEVTAQSLGIQGVQNTLKNLKAPYYLEN